MTALGRGVLADIAGFVFHRPETDTLIPFPTDRERQDYSQRVLQRLGIDVDRYTVLNIHRIGIDVPVRYVYEEVQKWDGESLCWPDHLATVERIDGNRRNIQIRLLGRWLARLPGLDQASRFGILFSLRALQFQHDPHPFDFDNARYLLYECSGGYPIGIFCIYVRSPVAARGEVEPTQLFFAVGFDFFGRSSRPRLDPMGRIWERVHNRVTANVLCRFRRDCEDEFRRLRLHGLSAESPDEAYSSVSDQLVVSPDSKPSEKIPPQD